MSEHGPYNQPPPNPYGGGDNSGGQPPYGQPHGAPYGDQSTGGQPGYGGPAGFPGPPDQHMYAGGQPPYGGGPGGPGGPGYPQPPQQPQGGGSKVGLWVVVGGGAVIIVLVIAVLVMLVTNGNDTPAAAPEDEASQSTGEVSGEETDEPAPGPDAVPAGEPPYSVPAEPCNAFTDQVISDFLIQDGGNKSVRDETSYCDSLDGAAPEGNAPEGYAAFEVVYNTPYSAADSVEAAKSDFQDAVQEVTGENQYSTMYDSGNVEESKEIDLGDEAHLVITKYDFLGDDIPQAVLLTRTANLNIRIEYQLHPSFSGNDTAEDLVLPDNIEEIMLNAGADALAVVGT